MKQFAQHTHGMPKLRQTDPIPQLDVDMDATMLALEDTQILASVKPPENFPATKQQPTGSDFIRVYIQFNEYIAGLDYLYTAIRKTLQKCHRMPRAIYMHPDIYLKCSQEHIQLFQVPLNHAFTTIGPYLQVTTIAIYTSTETGVKIPRETIICQW